MSRSANRELPEEDGGGKQDFRPRMRLVFQLLDSRQRLRIAWITVARIAVGVCDLLVAFAMYLLFQLLQGGLQRQSHWWVPQTALSAAFATAGLVALRATAEIVTAQFLHQEMQHWYTDFSLRLASAYDQLRWEQFTARNRSEFVNNVTDTVREVTYFYYRCIELTASVVVAATMVAALIYKSGIAACCLGFVVLLLYGMHRLLIRRKLRHAAHEREIFQRSFQKHLTDMFLSSKEIRTYANQQFFYDRIHSLANRLAASNLRSMLLPQIARVMTDQGVSVLFVCAVIVALLQHGDMRQLLSLLVFYFVLSRRLLPMISQTSMIAGQMESSYENVRILNAELQSCSKHRIREIQISQPRRDFILEAERLCFSFDKEAPLLDDIDFQMRKGEVIALCGASGSGKSSLLNLIAGVIQPDSGSLFVDRSKLAYVPQEIALLDDSIRNNLLFGLPHETDEALMRALAIANLDWFVLEQPGGLDTYTGDNGIMLSGGQRQRLGIARAILRGASLLLLDEATSALDEHNEHSILERLSASGISILRVSHRTDRRVTAHRTLLLQNGRLTEQPAQAIIAAG